MAGRKSKMKERIVVNDKCEQDTLGVLMKTIKKYVPDVFVLLAGNDKDDPRKKSYIKFSMGFLLIILFFKNALSITSMHAMANTFENSIITANLRSIAGVVQQMDFFPSYQTINYLLERLSCCFLERVRATIIKRLIRGKRFYKFRFSNKWWVIVIDGTQIYGGDRKINAHCQKRVHNRGTDNETESYYCTVLEAKLLLVGTPFMFSIDTEFITNDLDSTQENDTRGKEKIKQDCELNAFKRMAPRLHATYPKLPIIVMGDALYVANPVMDICKKYGWHFLLRYKEGAAKSIQEYVDVAIQAGDLQTIADQASLKMKNIGYYTGIPYGNHILNYLQVTSIDTEADKHGNKVIKETSFKFITDLEIPKKQKKILCMILLGRQRWTIENHGFNRQKNWESVLGHLCSWDETAMKNHYLMIQIVDIFRVLMEYEEYIQNEKMKTSDPDHPIPPARSFYQVTNDLRAGMKSKLFQETSWWCEVADIALPIPNAA